MATTNESASGLQRVKRMKAVAVGILAMMALAGCGVGADEYWDGNQLVSSNGQALEMQPGDVAAQALPAAPQVGATPMLAPVVQLGGGTVSLPQDPIPVKGFGPSTVQQIR
jgi:hypothetical protein